MNLRRTYSPAAGLKEVVGRGDGLNSLQLGILRLEPRETHQGASNAEETAFVLLSGICTLVCGDYAFERIGGRREVFDGPGFTVYLPPGTQYQVYAHTTIEAAIGSTPADHQGEPQLIRPEEVRYSSRGMLNWRRDIWDIMAPEFPSQHLVIVEVITPPGNWSSVPPHRHEQDRLPAEISQEEIYFYRLKPSRGFAMQRVYTDDRELDEAVVARHNDAVLIPRGYHPVAVAPGYTCYYLNFLSGTLKGMAPSDDPEHSWLKAVEATVKEWQPVTSNRRKD